MSAHVEDAAPPIHAFKLTETLASFAVATRTEDLPATALEHARQLILDTIGVALLASAHRVGQVITAHAAEWGREPPSASILGAGRIKASPPYAAQANGTMANALDYDGGGHLPTHILPVVLALTEAERRTGRDAVGAFVIAYECAARLTKVIDAKRDQHQGPTYRGWWHVGLIAPIAATLAACRLKNASAEQAAQAIGIATASSAGYRRSMGTMTKALHSGNGARGGIEAASLALHGFTGDPQIIEGELGFVDAVTFPDERDHRPVMERLGRPFALEKSPGVKRYPAVTPSHGVITAALELARQGGYAIEEITQVEADFRTFSLTRRHAADEEEAGFCAPYLIAASLVRGAFGPPEIMPEVVKDPLIQALSARVVQVPKVAGEGNEVRLKLRDGRTLSARAKGQRAFEKEFIERKFVQCASACLTRRAVDEIEEIVLHLDQQPSIDRLMRLASGG